MQAATCLFNPNANGVARLVGLETRLTEMRLGRIPFLPGLSMLNPDAANLNRLTTEASNPASARIDTLSPLEIVRLMNAEDAKVAEAVAHEAEAIARAIEVVSDRLRAGGRLIYLGAGTSGRLGVLDATECPPTFSTLPELVVGLIAGGPAALTRAVEGAEDVIPAGVEDSRVVM